MTIINKNTIFVYQLFFFFYKLSNLLNRSFAIFYLTNILRCTDEDDGLFEPANLSFILGTRESSSFKIE